MKARLEKKKKKKKLEKRESSTKGLEEYQQKLSHGTCVTDTSELILIELIDASQL